MSLQGYHSKKKKKKLAYFSHFVGSQLGAFKRMLEVVVANIIDVKKISSFKSSVIIKYYVIILNKSVI